MVRTSAPQHPASVNDTASHDEGETRTSRGIQSVEVGGQLLKALADRFAAAKVRGDTTHRAEEARYLMHLAGGGIIGHPDGIAAGMAVKYLGGSYMTRIERGQPGEKDPITPVPAATQREALEQLYADLSRGRDEAALVEVERLITLGAQELQISGNVPTALAALQTADTRLARLESPRFLPLRRVLARDIERLRAAPAVDITGIALKIDDGAARGVRLAT